MIHRDDLRNRVNDGRKALSTGQPFRICARRLFFSENNVVRAKAFGQVFVPFINRHRYASPEMACKLNSQVANFTSCTMN